MAAIHVRTRQSACKVVEEWTITRSNPFLRDCRVMNFFGGSFVMREFSEERWDEEERSRED